MPERQLSRLTSPQIAALPKDPGQVVLPIGAVEQHGPHLPTGTDFMIAERLLLDAMSRLPEQAAVWAVPGMPYGKSTEHADWAGTLSLSAATLLAFLHDLGRSLARAGFMRLAFLNGHGGNTALLYMAAREIRAESGLQVFTLNPSYTDAAPFEIPDEERLLGLHGGLVETSLLQVIAADTVHMDLAKAEYPELPKTESGVHFYGPISTGWLTTDWSRSGVFGDPAGSSAEKGLLLLDALAEQIATALVEISMFDLPDLGQ